MATLASELCAVDDRLVIGTWTTGIKGDYAKLLLSGTPGLFHVARDKGAPRRFSLYYLLSR